MPNFLLAVALAVLASAVASVLNSSLAGYVDRRGGHWRRPVYLMVSAFAGVMAGALATSAIEAVLLAGTFIIGAALLCVDIASHRLPDALNAALALWALVVLTIAAAIDDDWFRLGRSVLAALAIGAVLVLLSLLTKAGIGLGDTKLAAAGAIVLGWYGWSSVLLGFTAAFVLGGIYAVFLVLAGRAKARTAIAFGPWLIGGQVLALIAAT